MKACYKSEAGQEHMPVPGTQLGLAAVQVGAAASSAAPHRRALTLELLAAAAAVALLVAVLTAAVAAMAWGGKSGRGVAEGDVFFWGTFKRRSPPRGRSTASSMETSSQTTG